MKNLKHFAKVLMVVLAVAAVGVTAQAQDDRDIAAVSSNGSSIKFEARLQNAGATLIVSTPDGRVYRREFREGAAEFYIGDKEKLPDGNYSYELRLAPVVSAELSKTLNNGRGKDDEPEDVRATRKRTAVPLMVQSGGFVIQNGTIIVGGVEGQEKSQAPPKVLEAPRSGGSSVARIRRHHLSPMFMPDQVIPDDLIVQGSICAGFDCVNNEVFGFDTIRLKENNTRIQFDDTSGAGFPTNNWQIRANSSAGGGENFLGFVDQGAAGNSDTGTIVLQVNAGAPANSVKVESNGKIGFRTATPVLDLHVNTGDTPAHRLEQNNTGGFTAQTWDIAGNEANFFVRDVTSGSRLPFRIRPGAPTSSIDISAAGNVGIGTGSPIHKLDVAGNMTIGPGFNSSNTVPLNGLLVQGGVGIGTATPDQTLTVNGGASKPGGGSWSVFSDERLKLTRGRFNSGLRAVLQLQPIRYEYKKDNPLGLKSIGEHIGFGAQELQKIIPEAVTSTDSGYLQVNNDPIIWTMLNAIKEQQQQIEELKNEVKRLKAASQRRRK